MTPSPERCFPQNIRKAVLRRQPLSAVVRSDSSIADDSSSTKGTSLQRSLTAFDLILYGVGGSVGAGIYCLVGIGAEIAGPSISLSFLICGLACIFTSLSYSEFAARVPVAGSAYVYAYVSFGELVGFLIGWFLTLGYGFTASVVARSWGEYVASFLRESIAALTGREYGLTYLTMFPIPFIYETYTCSPLSIVIIFICTLVNISGVKESAIFTNALTVLNISVLAFVVLAGIGTETIISDNLIPFFTHGLSGVAQGAGLVFFAFIGFDMVACLSEEVIDPEINMPIGIVGSLLICTFIYVTISIAVVGMAPSSLLGPYVPITNSLLANACCTHEEQLAKHASEQCLSTMCAPVVHRILYYGGRFVSFGAIFGLTSGTFTSLMGQPRIWYRMAKDGLFFESFAKVNSVTKVPSWGIIITGIMTSFLACFIDLAALASLISLGTLMVFTFVDAGVIILRLRPSSTTSATLTEQQFETLTRQKNTGSRPVMLTTLFTISATLGFVSVTNKWHGLIAIASFIVTFISSICILRLPKSEPPDTFSCPMVPLIPMMGILSNTYMMGSLPLISWLFAIIWFLCGLVMYFTYSIWHSELGKQNRTLTAGIETEEMGSTSECTPLNTPTPSSPVLLKSYSSSDQFNDNQMEISLHQIAHRRNV